MPEDQIDLAAIATYLADNVVGFRDLQSMERIGPGQSNPNYLVRARSGSYVLRARPPGQLHHSAHRVDREFKVMRALAETPVAVPRVYHLAGDDNPLGRTFFIMDFVEGRTFWDPALPEVGSRQGRATIYDSMNQTLAFLHQIDPAAAGLGQFGRPENYFERQVRRWVEQYRLTQTGTVDAMERLIEWLGSNMPDDDGRVSIVHGDFRIDNMIFDAHRDAVAALLDWELSTLGHPFADLAYQCMHWRLPHASLYRGLGGIDREMLGLPSERDYVSAYCARSGIDEIRDWPFLVAFSYFRLAAICQGVYRRALDGNASNPQKAALYGNTARELAGWALDSLGL